MHTSAGVYAHMSICSFIPMAICMAGRRFTAMLIHIFMRMSMHMSMHTGLYTYTHVCTYVYT